MYHLLIVEAPVLTADMTTATTITISWTSAGSEDVSYEVMWETDDVGGCSGGIDMGSTTITDSSTSYDNIITELEEDSTYSITVTASNSAGSSAVSNNVTAMTIEAGERLPLLVVIIIILFLSFLIQLLLVLLLQSVVLVHPLLSYSSGD